VRGPSTSRASISSHTSPPKLAHVARGLRWRLTNGEARLWSKLRNRQLDRLKFRRQVPRGRFVADFLCDEAMLILEIDGSRHADTVVSDAPRTAYLRSLGYEVLRFMNWDVMQNTDRVLDHIQAVAVERRKAPSSALRAPSPQGEKGSRGPLEVDNR
jgi:very-short-patch-repair endonuclease